MPAPNHSLSEAMISAYDAGDMEQVIALGESAAETDEPALLWRGLAQYACARYRQAANTFASLTRMRPQVSAYWNNLGLACRQDGDMAGAEHAFKTALSLVPDDAELHYNIGLLHLQQRHWVLAKHALMDAVRLSPQFIEARLQAAHACYVGGDNDGQQAMLAGAADWPAQSGEQALSLAAMLSAQGELDIALDTLDRAQLPDGPAAGIMRLRIAAQRSALYERSNQLDRALEQLRQVPLDVLDQLPADDDARAEGWSAHAALSMRNADYATAAALYRRMLTLNLDDQHRASAAFGLATASSRMNQHDAVWPALQTAHAAQLNIAQDIVPELMRPDSMPLQMVTRLVERAAHEDWKPLPASRVGQQPVFVVGFPRSGTTLLEQMLDAHPDFRSMDERAFIHDLIEAMEMTGQCYPQDLASLTPDDADQLRAVYFRRVEQVVPDLGTRRLVDKNPLNMLCLPMIMRLFPQARIILCLRHPCDVLLSCYMQSFRSPAFMVLCSSLQRLAHGYVQAFEQWQRQVEVLAPNVLEWRYESVVSHFDDNVARLGQFLDIHDASPMARFSEHAQSKPFISTPSYAQVIQGISSKAVGRWQAYRQWFEPVLPILHPVMHRLGYAE
ncbi:tetratricopeptide repeat-containing sulfotransferase family protein [Rhodanobacter sp. T12-5]|uniref:tetratricopeptide repeat-containing sulfotransferase family protein n=1 Tax=Rhodanobacter sp. T12-5 TaxID=2024611 RepID=UPI0011ECF549|nr:tetratricopeptide repeat-containing sulfotransferase family protein [Rhodanobacter sp. T12-5]KAA0068251.1 sulfotransferase family protein [Rhodanobacter sp. T12-5]